MVSFLIRLVMQFVFWTLIFSLPTSEGEFVFFKAQKLILENPISLMVKDTVVGLIPTSNP